METDTIVEERPEIDEEIEISEPNLWKVILHNDDKTSMEFVISLLMQVFHKEAQEATELTLRVHTQGQAVAGKYTHEIAESKKDISVSTARAYGYPLEVTIEEDTEE